MEVSAVPAKLRPPSPETVPVRVMNKQIPTRFRVMLKARTREGGHCASGAPYAA
jgi:hypothetical protein